jgi:hypothetical protein
MLMHSFFKDISRKNLKKLRLCFYIPVKDITRKKLEGTVFVFLHTCDCQCKNCLKQLNSSVIIPNGPVNSEVNLSM